MRFGSVLIILIAIQCIHPVNAQHIIHGDTYFCLGYNRGASVDFQPEQPNAEVRVKFSVSQHIPVQVFLFIKAEVTMDFENREFGIISDDESMYYHNLLPEDEITVTLDQITEYSLYFWNPNSSKANVSFTILEMREDMIARHSWIMLPTIFAMNGIMIFLIIRFKDNLR